MGFPRTTRRQARLSTPVNRRPFLRPAPNVAPDLIASFERESISIKARGYGELLGSIDRWAAGKEPSRIPMGLPPDVAPAAENLERAGQPLAGIQAPFAQNERPGGVRTRPIGAPNGRVPTFRAVPNPGPEQL